MKRKFNFAFILICMCFQTLCQNDYVVLTYKNQGSPIFFLMDSVISVQRIDDVYKQAGITIGGGNTEWGNIKDGNVFFNLPQMVNDGRYKIVLYLGKQFSEFSFSGNTYVDKGLYIDVKNGKKTLAVNEYVLQNNKKFLERPYYPDLITASTEAIQSNDNAIVMLAHEITKSCKTDYERVAAVHDWVAAHIYYDFDAYRKGIYICDAVSVLNFRKGVCEGYANLCAALLRSLRIPCDVVSGYALGIDSSGEWDLASLNNDSNHAWNIAYPDNRIVIFDSTWDSMLRYEGGRYDADPAGDFTEAELNMIRSGKGTMSTPAKRHFDLTLEGLSVDHRIMSVSEPR